MWIRDGLVSAIREGLLETKDAFNDGDDDDIIVRVLPWCLWSTQLLGLVH